MHRLAARALANDGFATRRDARSCGLADLDLQRAVAAGTWVRLRRGAYAPASFTRLKSRDQHLVRLRSVLAELGPRYVGTHDTAVAVHGLGSGALVPDGLDDSVVHVARLGGAASRRTDALQYHRGAVDESHVVEVGGVRVLEPVRAVAETMTGLDLDDGAVLASGWLSSRRSDARRRGMLDEYDQAPDRARLTGVLRSFGRRSGTRAARDAAAIADGRCESVGEVRTLVLLWRYGIERPEPQFVIELGDDRWAETDFCWPQARLVLEFDGKKKYEDERAEGGPSAETKVMAEKRRERAIRDQRYRVVRITWADLVPGNQDRTAARLERELARAYAARARG